MQLKETFDRGELSEDELASLSRYGFFVWQQNSEYTDLDTEIRFKEHTNGEYESFNCNLTFDWGEKSFYLTIGYNLGEGFYIGADTKIENNRLIISDKNEKFDSLINQYPSEFNLLVKEVECALKFINP